MAIERPKPVAFITHNPAFDNDRAFDPAAVQSYNPGGKTGNIGLMAFSRLRDILAESGYRLATLDIIEREGREVRCLPLISFGWGQDAERYVARGAAPTVMFQWESPMVMWEVYHHLPAISRTVEHTLLLPGAAKRVAPGRHFTPILVPRHRLEIPFGPWAPRRYMTMVASNKRSRPVSIRNLLRAVLMRLFSRRPRYLKLSVRRQLICLVDRELASELYVERLRAIRFFSQRDDFALYGRGWESYDQRDRASVLRGYGGEVADKFDALTQYRFALAFENMTFQGYISEKIFDCFFAGCIPVYLGAPDIGDYIPADAFIDARRFRTYGELDRYLRGMTEAEADRRLSAAKEFLMSPNYELFDHTTLARSVASAFLKSFRG